MPPFSKTLSLYPSAPSCVILVIYSIQLSESVTFATESVYISTPPEKKATEVVLFASTGILNGESSGFNIILLLIIKMQMEEL